MILLLLQTIFVFLCLLSMHRGLEFTKALLSSRIVSQGERFMKISPLCLLLLQNVQMFHIYKNIYINIR